MSSNGFGNLRVIEPGPSPALALLLVLLYLGAAVAVLAAPWHWALRLAAILLLALACADAVRSHAWRRGRRAWRRLERLGAGRWRAVRGDGAVVEGRPHPDSFVHRWVVIAGVGDHPRFILIPADAIPGPDHRRLRAWLMWGSEHKG